MQFAIYELTLSEAYDRLDSARVDRKGLGARPVARELLCSALFWIDNAQQFAADGQFKSADYCVNTAVSFLRKIK